MDFKKIKVFFQRNLTTTIIVAILAFLFCASFGSSLLESWKLFSYKQELIHEIEVGKEQSSQLDEDIKQIGSQEYIERIARQYLELYYPNEQIVIPVENNLAKDKTEDNQKQPNQDQATTQETENTEQPAIEAQDEQEQSPVEEPTVDNETEQQEQLETEEQ